MRTWDVIERYHAEAVAVADGRPLSSPLQASLLSAPAGCDRDHQRLSSYLPHKPEHVESVTTVWRHGISGAALFADPCS